MEKEYLNSYKEKISKLDVNEQKLRDLYLRKLSLGEIQGPTTGYASIDKPWLKWYSEENIMYDFEPMSAYQLMEKHNSDNMDAITMEYYGKKITYKDLFNMIDIVAKSLLESGIKPGDVVMMSLPNIPEASYLFYALNKIGAVVNSIDPRTNQEEIEKTTRESNANWFFAIDAMTKKLEGLYDINIVSISPIESLPLPLKLAAFTKKNKVDKSNVIDWKKFISVGKKSKIGDVKSYFVEGENSIIVHTGGSTGTPKGVMLSNENFNALVYQLMNNNVGFRKNQRFLNILPPFIAMGLDDGLHLATVLGITNIMIPTFEPEDYPKLVKKYKPNVLLCGPIHCNMIVNTNVLSNEDLSYVEIVAVGGDNSSKESQEDFQKFLKEHNASANLFNAYGATETASGNTCVNKNCFKLQTVGALYTKNNAGIFDVDTDDEVQYCNGEIGELRISGPTLMKGYFGTSASETNQVIYEDNMNNRWYKTGDLAHFDNDGLLYIDGRIKRIITRRGFKIYPKQVEAILANHPAIKEIAIVGVPDKEELNIPVANIVISDEYVTNDNIKQEIIEYINDEVSKNFPEYALMAGFNFLDELPHTSIGKLDFKALEKLGILGNDEKQKQKEYKMI
ncbi:MAG: acyl--CoA ligase [Bacilli bacterium]|nr:acyl--CoA ligase [Bacilli bacterium]